MVFDKKYLCILLLIISCTEKNRTTHISHDLFVPENLEVTLWAQSPMLNNPTNMDVDYKGRIWITEAVNYRDYRNNDSFFMHRNKGDRVVILEDTDKDGIADTSKVFVQDEDLVSPIGIAVLGNKIIVSCSPNLIVYTDENGDDVPDKKEILLTGFGGKDHDHSLHAVYGGPDGNWYFNTGNAGPHIVTDKSGWTLRAGSMYTGGSPYNEKNEGHMISDDNKIWTGGLALRMNEEGKNLKVLGHNFRNSYEVIPDSYGNLWQNDNDDEVMACRTSWLMEGGNAGYFSADGTRNWKADQRPGQEIPVAHWHQDDPGVMPSGDITGAGAPTGITIIENDDLGKQYRGMVLSADAGRNIIFGYLPDVINSGYLMIARKVLITSLKNDENENYIWNDSSLKYQQNKWFRPSDVTIGTDGAIYVADWYDPVVGGHLMQDSTGFGRVYRITRKDKNMLPPEINLNTLEGQIMALKSPAINVRYSGFQQLKKQGAAVVEQVKELLEDENPYIQARATWLLSKLDSIGIHETEKLLKHKNELIRATAYRALRQVVPDVMPYAERMVTDSSDFVRREVVASLENVPFEQKKQLLLSLVEMKKDRWMLETMGKAMAGHESEMFAEIKKMTSIGIPANKWTSEMSMLAWRLHPPESLNDFALRANDSLLTTEARKEALTALGFIKNDAAKNVIRPLMNDNDPEIAETAKFWMNYLQPGSVKEEDIPGPMTTLKKTDPSVHYDIDAVLKLTADVKRGGELFTTNCRTCHKAGNEGSNIAPDLTLISKKYDDRQLLNAIIFPSAAVAFGYEPWIVDTKDKRSYYGFLISNDKEWMTIRDIAGKNHIVKKSAIASAKKQDKSLMPDPSQLGLTEQHLANILSYLKQVK